MTQATTPKPNGVLPHPPNSSPDTPEASLPTAAPPLLQANDPAVTSGVPSLLSSIITLLKPRITMMVLVSVWVGFMLGTTGGVWDWATMLSALMGAALSCMGASVLNQVYERDTDALMKRTEDRPMPTGRISVRPALVLGLVLSLVGVLMLGLMTTWLAAAVSALTVLSYVLFYTPMKRTTHMATVVGAVPGALPPMLGYAAATGAIGIEAWLLFAIMFVWQLPHTLAIYWLYRDDFAKAGFPMLPVIDPGGAQTFRQILIGSLLLLPLGLTPTLFGVSGLIYFFTAFACGLLMLGYSLALVKNPTRARARSLFFASLVYLPVVLIMMLADRV
jgi:heme o synthase